MQADKLTVNKTSGLICVSYENISIDMTLCFKEKERKQESSKKTTI